MRQVLVIAALMLPDHGSARLHPRNPDSAVPRPALWFSPPGLGVGLVVGERIIDGARDVELVNWGPVDVAVNTDRGRVPYVLQYQQEDGTFADASAWVGSSCGNAYRDVWVKSGWARLAPFKVPSAGRVGTVRLKARVRDAQGWGPNETVYSAPFTGRFDLTQVHNFRVKMRQVASLTSRQALRLFLGRDPEVQRWMQSPERARLRRAVVRRLLQPLQDGDPEVRRAFVRVVERPDPDALRPTVADGREWAPLVVLALRGLCHADPETAERLSEQALRRPRWPGREHYIRWGLCPSIPDFIQALESNPSASNAHYLSDQLAEIVRRDKPVDAQVVEGLQRLSRNERLPEQVRQRAAALARRARAWLHREVKRPEVR